MRGWHLPRNILLEVLNRLNIDLAADPDGLLDEQIVPYADMFTYPFSLPPIPPFVQPLVFTFFVKRDDAKLLLGIVAGHFLSESSLDN
jgi:hypothetical protein